MSIDSHPPTPSRVCHQFNEPVEKVRQRRSRAFVGFALTGLALFAPFALTYSVYAPGAKAPAALPVERHVLACTGWAGATAGLFEQAPGLS